MTDVHNGINSAPKDGSNRPKGHPEPTFVRKLKSVLTKIIEPSFKISDDTVLEKLFTYLSERCIKLDEKAKLAELAVYVPWLCIVKKQWLKLDSSVKAFALRIASLVGSVPSGFFTLYESEILKSFCSFVDKEDKKIDFIIILSYSEMLHAIIMHSSGVHWVVETGAWKDVVTFAHRSNSIYTFRSLCRFLASLVKTLETIDIGLCHTILDMVLDPLRTCSIGAITSSKEEEGKTEEKNKNLVKSEYSREIVIATLKLVSQILICFLDARLPPERINGIIERYKLEDWAWKRLHEESTDVELITYISKLLCLLHTATISRTEKDEIYYTVMRNMTLLALKHLHVAILKHFFTLVLDVCVEYQILWHKYGGKVIYTEEDLQHDVFDIENNLIITQAMPTFICMKVTRVMESDVMDLFAEKVFSLSCTETQRVCYAYRDCLRESTDRSLEALCHQGILSFSRVTNFVKREQAVMAFQCMMHTLKEFVPEEVSDISADCIVARRHTQSLVTRFPSILCSLLDGLTKYISAFQFNWRDSLETICILNFLQGLINNPNISSLLCAKALQLTKLVITSFIPPNLALLVDTLQGSSMGDLGKQLFKKLHDIHWEVRDSSLEVLQAISAIADAKFPAFQSLLIENDLPRVVASLAISDSDSYVRASGMACLREMVKIQAIWENCLYDQKIIDNLLRILHYDTEGLPRYQATLLITAVYKHQTVPCVMLERLYDTMCYVAVYDLHWEVKIGALEFWSSVIENTKTQEGMIDGDFPEVTFSRQAKKIVTLDPPEIRSRLLRILRTLSIAGCLHALWKTFIDEYDLEVMKKSLNIIKPLLDLLSKYNLPKMMEKETIIECVYHRSSNDSNPSKCKEKNVEKENEEKKEMTSEEVIELIVNEKDIDLLSTKVLFGKPNKTGPEPKKPRIILPLNEFLENIYSVNLEEVMKEKIQWATLKRDNLDSLMEDIISLNTSNSESDQNMIDCY